MICTLCIRKYYEGMPCYDPNCELYKIRQPLPDTDHWTMPEDEEVEARPGWGWIKLDKIWWSVKLDEYKNWHDRVTKKGSIVQKLGASVERINEAQKQLLKNKGLGGWIVDNFVKRIQRFFYEGKLK